MKEQLTKKEFIEKFKRHAIENYGRELADIHITEKYMLLGEMIREYAGYRWKDSKETLANTGQKQMYYFSMEFLMGRLLTNNLMNLGIYDVVKEGMQELGMDINQIEELESDAGLGNGGLGRLAACFLDSLASTNYAGHGNCIRYEYGFFKQLIENNEQQEVPDLWLRLGNIWEVRKPKGTVQVHFGGYVNQYMNENGKIKVKLVDSEIINAVPYDVPIVGYDTKLTNTLRLWKAEPAEESMHGDYTKYIQDVRNICNSLYPDDSTEEGKLLRVKQQYFFVCAGIHSMIRSHLRVYPSLDNLAEKVAVQLNDTHPVLAIPELMRVLLDDYEYEWDQAWEITRNTMAYTNHTVLAEALEKWPIHYIQTLLPRIYMIIEEIQHRFEFNLNHKYAHPEYLNAVSIIKDGQVHMAHLAIVGSHSVNGVAKLHSQILKDDVMKEFATIMPYKFNNKTNGITHRRWLLYSDPQLTSLIEKRIGTGFKKDPQQLKKLLAYVDDEKTQQEFLAVKLERKKILAAYIKRHCNVEIDVNSIIDVQAKRLHAYKRQLLNVMHIIYLYQKMKADPNFRIYPRTFIFAAKAAPAYVFAKKVIKLINCIADKVNNDPEISKYMKVVFIPNYGVSIAEILMNAADVSEQISTAGKEASGTGNMKFMMNGALTLGTLDGANVEIVEHVGFENAEIFGLRAEEVAAIKKNNTSNVWDYYNGDAELRAVIDSIADTTWSNVKDDFKPITDELMFKNDEYLLCADFRSYCEAQKNVRARYEDKASWARMCLVNIAESGYFSSDRTIEEYAKEIWHLEKVKVK
ncbi:MAG: glycogen/starch/alpha-glucan phosphorylase [Erysipelotrichia bacterium]|nr:glycogen/starch/alpha-glucan phosphorylase [Erysipelotrichia bacterium]